MYWCAIPPIFLCPKMYVIGLIGFLAKVSPVHRPSFERDGRCLAVIFIQKYLYHQTGFCASEVPPRIVIETVHQTWHTLKNFLKNPNILIFFRFS